MTRHSNSHHDSKKAVARQRNIQAEPTPGSSLPAQIVDPNLETARPRVGPSDSSDSPSDRPASDASTDSDSQHTGERSDADPQRRDETGQDIEPDTLADENEVGLSRTRPDPVRNGGDPDKEKNDPDQ